MGRIKKSFFEHDVNSISEIFKALGHPARLQIMKVLLENKRCTCGEIVNKLPLAQSTVSKHLIELKKVNLIAERFEGKKTIFFLKKQGLTDSNDYLTNYITNCKIANAFNESKKIGSNDVLEKILAQKQHSIKPSRENLKKYNHVFTKKNKS